jgi:RHS repeat-associated protein
MDSANAYIYGIRGTPSEQVNLSTGAITYLVGDSLGSVRGTVSASGTLTGTTAYDAWGNPQTTGGLIASTPFGFAGGYTDPTGLIYLINRYYDPATGQFISLDPQVSQSLAPYNYANGNPVSNTDPTGLRTGTYCQRVYWLSNWRYCDYFFNEAAVHRIKVALEYGLGVATICGAIGGPVAGTLCWINDGLIAISYAYVDQNDHGRGEYLHVDYWRYVIVISILWYHHVTIGPWWAYWGWLHSQ